MLRLRIAEVSGAFLRLAMRLGGVRPLRTARERARARFKGRGVRRG